MVSAPHDVSADPSPPVTILLDPDDDYGTIQAVLSAHNPAQGVVALDPTVGTSAMAALAQDLLVALGKDPAIVARSRAKPAALWTAATAWLAGAGVRRLVILRAHRLPRHALARLIQLAGDARTALTLVWHAPAPPVWEAVLPTTTLAVLHDTAAAIEPQPPARAVTPKADRPKQECVPLLKSQQHEQALRLFAQELPDLSPSDVLHFRADAARELSGEDFARVDVLYAYGMDVACVFLSAEFPVNTPAASADEPTPSRAPETFSHQPEQPAGATIPDSEVAASILLTLNDIDRQVGGLPSVSPSLPAPMPRITPHLQCFLIRSVAGAPTPTHALAILRGAQAGFLLHGVHLTFSTEPQRLVGPGFADPVFTAEIAGRIRSRILDPAHAGALTALLAAGLSPFDITLVRLDQLAPDAATLECQTGVLDAVFPIPEWGRDLLAAARAFAALHDDGAYSYFLATGVGVRDQTLADTARACDLWPSRLAHDGSPWYRTAACMQVADIYHPRTPTAAYLAPTIVL